MDHAAKGKRMPPISSNFSKDPAPSDLDPSNIFVKYLPSALRDSDLTELFQGYGEVLSSKIMIDPNSRKSLGFGFVRFSSETEASKAIAAMDGHRIGTKRLLCKLANSPKEKEEPIPVSAGKATSDESPRLHVANKAGVGSYSKPKASSSSSSSYAAASFTAPPSPSPATLTVRTSSLSLHAVSRSSSTPNLPSSPPLHSGSGGNTHHHHHHHPKLSTNLYVKELLDSDTEETLHDLFNQFGEIEGCKVMVDKITRLSRCIGFVRFKTQEQATKAMQAMNGRQREDSVLVVKYADDERQRELRKRQQRLALANPRSFPTHTAANPVAAPGYPGMMMRHGSSEGLHDDPTRVAAPFMPVAWPYAWSGAPLYTPAVYDSSWLVMLSPESYTSPRSPQHRTFYAPSIPSMYYHFDPAASNDHLAVHRTYAHTAPIPLTPAALEPERIQDNYPSSAPSS